jgi:hypothetical protein
MAMVLKNGDSVLFGSRAPLSAQIWGRITGTAIQRHVLMEDVCRFLTMTNLLEGIPDRGSSIVVNRGGKGRKPDGFFDSFMDEETSALKPRLT